MKIIYENCFWCDKNDEKSQVFQVFPDVYGDNRGDFCEVLKDSGEWFENSNYPLWFSNLTWIRQINRSKSINGVIRGCHAQKGIFCQGKLVEVINRRIYDVITDARPDSETFGSSGIYLLDPLKQNKLWIPHGFLHTFIVPYEDNAPKAIFNYYVDNSYNKESEIGINPKSVIPFLIEENKKINQNFEYLYEMFSENKDLIYSEKDINGLEYSKFMKSIKFDYENTGKVWYK